NLPKETQQELNEIQVEVQGSGNVSRPEAASSYKELVEYCERIILEEADEK
ncbi:hypothetical protein LCGC14_3114030, partial [marine sediment metagenome]